MKTQNIFNNKVSFGSKNCPIKPFSIETSKGILNVEELKPSDCGEAGKFSFECGLEAFSDWQENYNLKSDKIAYTEKAIKFHTEGHLHTLSKSDGNSTILIARDSSHNIRALFSMQNFDEFKSRPNGFSDLKTGFVEECLIDSAYRNQGIGQILLERIMGTAKGKFTDIFIDAANDAINFYKRAGFLPLDISNPKIKKISDYILLQRKDRDTITLMTKTLDSSNPWWKRVARKIR